MTNAQVKGGVGTARAGPAEALSVRPRWEPLVRGVIVLVLGLLVFLAPDLTLERFVTFFGTLVFTEGIFHLVGGLRVKAVNPQWTMMSIGGAFSLGLGMFVVGWSEGIELDLLPYIAAWAIVTGTVHTVFAAKAGVATRMAILFVAGLVGIAFGLMTLLAPDGLAMDLVTPISGAFVAIGVLLAAFGASVGDVAEE